MSAMGATADTSKDPLGEATGIMRFVYKGSEAALRAVSGRQTVGKRGQPTNAGRSSQGATDKTCGGGHNSTSEL
jgi:hypothetical protein